jgi:uncharacterized membrane protein
MHHIHPKAVKQLSIIRWLSVLGLMVCVYLIYLHYKPNEHAFCNINDYFNCDIVNKSEYSVLFGIPVSILGALAYVAIFATTTALIRQKLPRIALGLLALFCAISLAFALYLSAMEFFILYAVCIFCVASQLIIISIFSLSLNIWLKHPRWLAE